MLNLEKNKTFLASKTEQAGLANSMKKISRGILSNFNGSLVFFPHSFYEERFSCEGKNTVFKILWTNLTSRRTKLFLMGLTLKTNLVIEFKKILKEFLKKRKKISFLLKKKSTKSLAKIFCFKEQNKNKASIKKEIRIFQ